jgi:hypothetical protein
MDIDLSGVQIRVPQPLLQLIRRYPLLCFVGRERMPEGMTGRFLGNPRFFPVLDHEFANPPL